MTSDSALPDGFIPANYRILVVDDDVTICNLMKLMLVHDGFRVETALDGTAGLEILESQHFDLLMLDDILPVLDAFEMLRRIRADTRWDKMPVLMWGGMWGSYDEEEFLARCWEAGADSYLTKPILHKQLIEEVYYLLTDDREAPAETQ